MMLVVIPNAERNMKIPLILLDFFLWSIYDSSYLLIILQEPIINTDLYNQDQNDTMVYSRHGGYRTGLQLILAKMIIIMYTLSRIQPLELQLLNVYEIQNPDLRLNCMRIIAFGDIHMAPANAGEIPAIDTADLLIVTGDITNYGNRLEAETVLSSLADLNSSILAVAGNLDQPDVATYLEDRGQSLHGRGLVFDDLGIMGLGGSNYTPFHTPYEFSEPRLASFLASGYAQIRVAADFILVSHAPPVDTETDRLTDGSHVGSSAVRTFLEERQPLLCITGHIHESRGQDKIGRTIVLNPGMLKEGGYIEVIYETGELAAALRSTVNTA